MTNKEFGDQLDEVLKKNSETKPKTTMDKLREKTEQKPKESKYVELTQKEKEEISSDLGIMGADWLRSGGVTKDGKIVFTSLDGSDTKIGMVTEDLENLKLKDWKRKEPKPLKENCINILDDSESKEVNNWGSVKFRMLGICKSEGLRFISHKEDEIVGKPERMFDVKKNYILITKAQKKDSGGEIKTKYLFLDDPYNRRDDGYEQEVLGLHFWTYRVVENAIEYIVLSEKELDPQQHRLRGMRIDLKDSSEFTKTLRIGTISNLFLAVENEPSIKPMPKEELIDFVQNLGLTKEEFIEYLYTHPRDKKVYGHSENYSKIRVIHELSGKYEGYPLHLFIWGAVGRGKTMELECINGKFDESRGIWEAGSGTLKGIIPSYSEKPANMGHIIKCHRRALIDEVSKMFERTQNYEMVTDYLGQLNFILEHKDREVGSGNSNNVRTQATAKITFATNPFGRRRFLYDHIDLIDSTTLSRILHLCVDKEEYEFIKANKPKKAGHSKINNYQFLSIYDSCQDFLVEYDDERVRDIFKQSVERAKNFREIWEARGLHHSILLLDGIVKSRCLFDGDKSFKAQECDYLELEKTLAYLERSWLFPLKSG